MKLICFECRGKGNKKFYTKSLCNECHNSHNNTYSHQGEYTKKYCKKCGNKGFTEEFKIEECNSCYGRGFLTA